MVVIGETLETLKQLDKATCVCRRLPFIPTFLLSIVQECKCAVFAFLFLPQSQYSTVCRIIYIMVQYSCRYMYCTYLFGANSSTARIAITNQPFPWSYKADWWPPRFVSSVLFYGNLSLQLVWRNSRSYVVLGRLRSLPLHGFQFRVKRYDFVSRCTYLGLFWRWESFKWLL